MEKKILVADDSLTIQKVVELTFVDSDYRLTCVSNGRLALEKIREEAPDVVLADVVMPEKNGYEVCEEIKKNPATASIPVILLAGTFEPFDRDRAQRLGCDAIVSKPFDSRELFRKVESLVAQRSGPVAVPTRDRNTDPLRPAEAPAAPTVEERSAPSPFAAAPPSAFDAGFVEEDFTGSIRTLHAGRGEPLAHLYGPDDVESALAAFREVEPTSRATDWRDSAPAPDPSVARPTRESGARYLDEGAEPDDLEEPGERTLPTAAEDNRTRRIDVSSFRSLWLEAGRVEPVAGESAAETVTAEPLPPQPLDLPARKTPVTVDSAASSGGVSSIARELTDLELDRLAERLAAKVVEKLSERIVREVAWEVVPETAEMVVRERLRELESGVD